MIPLKFSNIKHQFFAGTLLTISAILWFIMEPINAFFWTIFFVWLAFRLDERILGGIAIAFLVLIPATQYFHMDAQAERFAIYAYFLLVIIVVLQIIELKRDKGSGVSSNEAPPEKMCGIQPLNLHRIIKTHAISSLIKKYLVVLFFLLLSIFILSKILLPGYILTFDMAWTPEMPYAWSTETPNNSSIVYAFLHTLSLIIPSWIVQKVLLVALFFLLFFIPWKFMPFVQGTPARIFTAGIFALNPFVYTRILAGQWFHLLAYAFFPLLLYALVRLSQKPNRRSAATFFFALCFISLFSVHYLYLAGLMSAIWLFAYITRTLWDKKEGYADRIAGYALTGGIGFIIANLFWIIPAFMRDAPLEARFNESFFSAFAAAGNGNVPVMENVAVLGGFWGEGLVWRYYFLWPQDHIIFWAGVFTIGVLIMWGTWRLCKNPLTRFYAFILLGIGIFSYITALGIADTPFRPFNMFLYNYMPFWSGLRDSHKIAGILALVYALFAGMGVSAFFEKIKQRSIQLESVASIIIFVLPVTLGMYMWGGFHSQLNPVWYPQEWYEANAVIQKMPSEEKVLVLPWHGYFSLDFADNRIITNPAEAFFGRDRVISGRGIDFSAIHDQEIDPYYRKTDILLNNAQNLSPETLVSRLKELGITSLLIITNEAIPRSQEGLTRWTTFSNGGSDDAIDIEQEKTWEEMLPARTTTVFTGKSIIIKRIIP